MMSPHAARPAILIASLALACAGCSKGSAPPTAPALIQPIPGHLVGTWSGIVSEVASSLPLQIAISPETVVVVRNGIAIPTTARSEEDPSIEFQLVDGGTVKYFRGTRADSTLGGTISTSASQTGTWSTIEQVVPALFDHNTMTNYPLTGAHTTLQCVVCHATTNYSAAPIACFGCHQTDFNGTTNPAHGAAGFPTTCDVCHTTFNWGGATFNHNTQTTFKLTGAHVALACVACHLNGVFAGTPTDCYSCHQTDYNNTNNPSHVAGGISTQCQNCHTTTSWSPAAV